MLLRGGGKWEDDEAGVFRKTGLGAAFPQMGSCWPRSRCRHCLWAGLGTAARAALLAGDPGLAREFCFLYLHGALWHGWAPETPLGETPVHLGIRGERSPPRSWCLFSRVPLARSCPFPRSAWLAARSAGTGLCCQRAGTALPQVSTSAGRFAAATQGPCLGDSVTDERSLGQTGAVAAGPCRCPPRPATAAP